jgi:hypothetical protein
MASSGLLASRVIDYREQTRSFTGLVEYHSTPFILLGRGESQRVQTAVVSDTFFEVMGLDCAGRRDLRAVGPTAVPRHAPGGAHGAFTITMTGLVGVMAFAVNQRMQEFGIRMALGADAGSVRGMLLRQGMLLVLVGLGLGAAGALVFTRALSGLLFEIEPTDPFTFLSVSIVLLSVAALACFLPARRATLVPPMVALRSA